MHLKKISIVVLSYNRPDEVRRCVAELLEISYPNIEIVVVDNASETPVDRLIGVSDRVSVIRLPENVGVAGRNAGISRSTGELVVTIDDDIFGVNDDVIQRVVAAFEDPSVLAVNFKVIDDVTEQQINWCHHRKIEIYGSADFDTYEISEGAVAFRREAIIAAGMYPDYFFISHEGPDLAIRIMNLGGRVVYRGDIVVRHSHSLTARTSWRRYYFDTRNQVLFSVRAHPVSLMIPYLFLGLLSMLFYSLRDGYIKYWFKGLIDSLRMMSIARRDRFSMSPDCYIRYIEIKKFNAGFIYMVKKRVFSRIVKI